MSVEPFENRVKGEAGILRECNDAFLGIVNRSHAARLLTTVVVFLFVMADKVLLLALTRGL